MSPDLRRSPLRHVPDATVMLRSRIVFGIWGLAAAGLLWSAAHRQVVEVDRWRDLASRQHRIETRMPAERGSIVDRGGVPLALSHETVRIGIAPQELADRARTAALLGEALQIPVSEAERLAFSEKGWVMVPGRFPPSAGETLSSHRGVYVQRELSRFYTQDAGGRGLLGAVIDQSGAGGIEQQFETHLRGSLGTGLIARDSRGGAIPGEAWEIRAPRAGGSVVLAIDAAVQEIVVEALREAVESTRSVGGDVIVTDPRTGEILAMASLRDGNAGRLGGITTSYEPGSTLKPFTVAALLRAEKATFDDSVDTGRGSWTFAGRTINDVSTVGTASLRDVLVVSSNVGVAKLAQRLTPAEQYETLRDFGFGVRSGILLPGEASGRLRRPEHWSRQSPASLAIGYEVSVTPLQMAMAYGAIANGGVLMQPVPSQGDQGFRRPHDPDVSTAPGPESRVRAGGARDHRRPSQRGRGGHGHPRAPRLLRGCRKKRNEPGVRPRCRLRVAGLSPLLRRLLPRRQSPDPSRREARAAARRLLRRLDCGPRHPGHDGGDPRGARTSRRPGGIRCARPPAARNRRGNRSRRFPLEFHPSGGDAAPPAYAVRCR